MDEIVGIDVGFRLEQEDNGDMDGLMQEGIRCAAAAYRLFCQIRRADRRLVRLREWRVGVEEAAGRLGVESLSWEDKVREMEEELARARGELQGVRGELQRRRKELMELNAAEEREIKARKGDSEEMERVEARIREINVRLLGSDSTNPSWERIGRRSRPEERRNCKESGRGPGVRLVTTNALKHNVTSVAMLSDNERSTAVEGARRNQGKSGESSTKDLPLKKRPSNTLKFTPAPDTIERGNNRLNSTIEERRGGGKPSHDKMGDKTRVMGESTATDAMLQHGCNPCTSLSVSVPTENSPITPFEVVGGAAAPGPKQPDNRSSDLAMEVDIPSDNKQEKEPLIRAVVMERPPGGAEHSYPTQDTRAEHDAGEDTLRQSVWKASAVSETPQDTSVTAKGTSGGDRNGCLVESISRSNIVQGNTVPSPLEVSPMNTSQSSRLGLVDEFFERRPVPSTEDREEEMSLNTNAGVPRPDSGTNEDRCPSSILASPSIARTQSEPAENKNLKPPEASDIPSTVPLPLATSKKTNSNKPNGILDDSICQILNLVTSQRPKVDLGASNGSSTVIARSSAGAVHSSVSFRRIAQCAG
uniref:Uncharacterized protein n=1 Tax=Compsopogon caeruleus TaxID=31354 RepID=A0A7S1TEL7_9RHOD